MPVMSNFKRNCKDETSNKASDSVAALIKNVKLADEVTRR
jgi:hypothetical protein